jgi:hypothetical protein
MIGMTYIHQENIRPRASAVLLLAQEAIWHTTVTEREFTSPDLLTAFPMLSTLPYLGQSHPALGQHLEGGAPC